MPDFPTYRWPPLNVITPFHLEAQAMTARATDSCFSRVASGTVGGANFIHYLPFQLYEVTTAVKMSWITGATNTGNIDVGIYDSQKNRLVNSGSIALGTANTLQVADITDTTLAPGLYFMAIQLSSTGTVFRNAPADEGWLASCAAYQEAAGSFGLPATATFTLHTGNPSIPALGVHFDTLV